MDHFSAGRLVTLALVLLAGRITAQNTIGLVDFANDHADGYVLIYPDQQGTMYLLNSCGEVVHTWPDSTSVPGNGSRLVANGSVLRTYVDEAGGNPFFTAGGNGQHVQIKDWDNTILWDYTVSSSTECMHHDAEMLPNGNVLIIVWELKTIQEAYDAGRDTTGFGYNTLWPEKVIEVQPFAPDSGVVVWEWHVWDHLIQDNDPLAQNFGVVADHPELVDINKVYTQNNNPDWLHINSIDYNPALDQIMLSVPFLNEVWIIDHSTTTAEAAGHTGGISGKGGDLLYRWGNAAIYDRGLPSDQQLFFNHAAIWTGPGLAPGDPDSGKIMVFNNRVQPGVSAIDLFAPPMDSTGNYVLQTGAAFGPAVREKRFALQTPTDFSSPGQGSGQLLPNGHVLATSGRQGWVVSIRPDSTLAWSYVTPMINGIPVAQGTDIVDRTILFQAEWVHPDDDRLDGRVLDAIGYLELDPDTLFCSFPMSSHFVHGSSADWVSVVDDRLLLGPDLRNERNYRVIDIAGKIIKLEKDTDIQQGIGLAGLPPGLYLIQFGNGTEPRKFVVSRR